MAFNLLQVLNIIWRVGGHILNDQVGTQRFKVQLFTVQPREHSKLFRVQLSNIYNCFVMKILTELNYQ